MTSNTILASNLVRHKRVARVACIADIHSRRWAVKGFGCLLLLQPQHPDEIGGQANHSRVGEVESHGWTAW